MLNLTLLTSPFIRSTKCLFFRPSSNFCVLDGVRAFSILWVILCHTVTLGPSGYLEKNDLGEAFENSKFYYAFSLNGFYGVDIFFVMSGLLISGLIFKEMDRTGTLNLGNFYMRRLLRLSPALIVLALFSYFTKQLNYENLLYNIFYVNNFLPIENNAISHTWSLAVEEQFYIAFSLLMLTTKKPEKLFSFILGLAVSAVGIRFLVVLVYWSDVNIQMFDLLGYHQEKRTSYMDAVYIKPYTRYGAFVFGVLAMHAYRYKISYVKNFLASFQGKLTLYLSIALTLSISFLNLYKPSLPLEETQLFIYHCFAGYLFSASISMIILSMLAGYKLLMPVKIFLSMKAWYPIAQLAYSLYLFHLLAINMATIPLMKAISENSGWSFGPTHAIWAFFNISLTLFFSLCVSSLVYIFIERPFMTLRNVLYAPKAKQLASTVV